PRVRHHQGDVRPRVHAEVRTGVLCADVYVEGLDRQPPPTGHRVARVHHQVHEDLFDLAGISAHRPEVGGEPRLELDVLASDPAEDGLDVPNDRVEGDDLHLEHLATAEREQLPSEIGGTRGGVVDVDDVGPLLTSDR